MKKLFEAELKNNSGIPDKYFEKLVQRGRALYGHGPTFNDQVEFQNTFFALLAVQNGHEDELTEIGRDIIMKHYGDILDRVKLDIEIVKPGDEEQVEMAMETIQPPEVETEDEDITHLKEDIDKRKMLNVLMQGEAQNIHDLLYFEKDRLDAINPNLLRLDLALIKKDILLHWNDNLDLQTAMEATYKYANIVKVTWSEEDMSKKKELKKPKPYDPNEKNEDEEEKHERPTIKVRALMLSGLVHETVKGIYELIAHRGIEIEDEEDREKMKRVMSQTDTLENEKEDIQFGSFVAADVRDFVNKVLDEIPGADKVSNMREFVFGHLAEIPAKEFNVIIKGVLGKDEKTTKELKENIKLLVRQVKGETAEFHAYKSEKELPKAALQQPERIGKPELAAEEKPEKKKKKWVEYGQGELKYMLDQAIDKKDWALVKEIQPWIKESTIVKTKISISE